jgi:ferredoxin-thioredoxin reductase catalytic subunit
MSKLGNGEDATTYVRQVARRRGWVMNNDTSLTGTILDGLAARSQEWGRPFCPCRDLEGSADANTDIVCPCHYAQADIDEFGQCYCGLFLAVGKDQKEVSSIPERRAEH